jgi:hypothetical protein
VICASIPHDSIKEMARSSEGVRTWVTCGPRVLGCRSRGASSCSGSRCAAGS